MTVHDNFDGSAHCIECEGPCRLTGDDRAVTSLVRYVLEQLALHDGYVGGLLQDALRGLCGHEQAGKLWTRAKLSARQLRNIIE